MVDGVRIRQAGVAKYLGVWLDRRKNFGEHVNQVAQKAHRTTVALAKMMPRRAARRLIMSVTASIILYAAPAWGAAMAVKRNSNVLDAVQRRAALSVAAGYRTVSGEAVRVLAGMPPSKQQNKQKEWDACCPGRCTITRGVARDLGCLEQRKMDLEAYQEDRAMAKEEKGGAGLT